MCSFYSDFGRPGDGPAQVAKVELRWIQHRPGSWRGQWSHSLVSFYWFSLLLPLLFSCGSLFLRIVFSQSTGNIQGSIQEREQYSGTRLTYLLNKHYSNDVYPLKIFLNSNTLAITRLCVTLILQLETRFLPTKDSKLPKSSTTLKSMRRKHGNFFFNRLGFLFIVVEFWSLTIFSRKKKYCHNLLLFLGSRFGILPKLVSWVNM